MTKINSINNGTIIHMIGYCDSAKFIDAINYCPFRSVIDLANVIDETYGGNIVEDIAYNIYCRIMDDRIIDEEKIKLHKRMWEHFETEYPKIAKQVKEDYI